MSDEAKPIDLEAARKALLSGQSLIDHLQLPPDLSKILYGVAQLHFEAGRFAEAKQVCIQLVAVDPRLPAAWSLLGNSFMREGEFAEALEAWSHALYLKPDFRLALEVTRAAVALKDPASALVGLAAMRKRADSAAQKVLCDEWQQSVLAIASAT